MYLAESRGSRADGSIADFASPLSSEMHSDLLAELLTRFYPGSDAETTARMRKEFANIDIYYIS